MLRHYTAADRLLFVLAWLLLLAGALLLFPSEVRAQVSSSLGGDLRGPPSNASVRRVRGIPVGPGTPSNDDTLIFNGGEANWGPPAGGGGGGGVQGLIHSPTIGVTSAVFIGTAPVTVSSYSVPSENVTPGYRLSHMAFGTMTVTGSTVFTLRVYINGGLVQSNAQTASSGTVNAFRMNGTTVWLRSGGAGTGFCFGQHGFAMNTNTFTTITPFDVLYGWQFPPALDLSSTFVETTLSAANSNPGNSFTFVEDQWIIWP